MDDKTVIATVLDELRASLGKVSTESIRAAVEQIGSARRVFLAAAGRSALGVRGFAMRLMHMGKTAFVAGDVTTPAITADDLLVIGSGSGRTGSLLSMAQSAGRVGAKIVLFTIDPQSPIAQLASLVVVIPTPSPKVADGKGTGESIQPMGSLFEQSLFVLLDCLIVLMMAREGVSSRQMFARHANLE